MKFKDIILPINYIVFGMFLQTIINTPFFIVFLLGISLFLITNVLKHIYVRKQRKKLFEEFTQNNDWL